MALDTYTLLLVFEFRLLRVCTHPTDNSFGHDCADVQKNKIWLKGQTAPKQKKALRAHSIVLWWPGAGRIIPKDISAHCPMRRRIASCGFCRSSLAWKTSNVGWKRFPVLYTPKPIDWKETKCLMQAAKSSATLKVELTYKYVSAMRIQVILKKTHRIREGFSSRVRFLYCLHVLK